MPKLTLKGEPSDEEVVYTRERPNLRKEIRGKTKWVELQILEESRYDVFDEEEGNWRVVEYISGEWHWITWEDDDWWTCVRRPV